LSSVYDGLATYVGDLLAH